MFQAEQYLSSLTALLKQAFEDRLLYVGLQGSYLRGEATESSDIDIMVVIRNLEREDLLQYRKAIQSLAGYDLSCGFICGEEEMRHWNPLEICHLVHTTRDYYGELKALVPAYSDYDVRSFVKMSLGNLYHEICHRLIHRPEERSREALPFTYKGVFFILQNLHYLESGKFIATKKELLGALTGRDRQVLETAMAYARGERPDFHQAFSLLFSWCKETMISV